MRARIAATQSLSGGWCMRRAVGFRKDSGMYRFELTRQLLRLGE